MNLSEDIVFFFTALGPNYSTNSAQLYGVTRDDRVVEVMAPDRVVHPLITQGEGLSLPLDGLGWTVFDNKLTYFWNGTKFNGSRADSSDTYIGQVHGDGRSIPVSAEVPGQTQYGFPDSVAVIGDDLYARFGDLPGQYWRFDTDLAATQATNFFRPNAYGAQGDVTQFGDAIYFIADQQTPLNVPELWRILSDGTVEPALNITGSSELTDLIVFDGSLWAVAYGYSGEGPRMFRFDTPDGAPVELTLSTLIGPWGFEVIGGALHLFTQKGLFPLAADGTLGDNLFTTIGIGNTVWEVVEFDGDLYAAISDNAGTVLARRNPDGTYETLFDVPGFNWERVQKLTVHEGALYFEGGRAVDDGFGGIELDQSNLYRMDADGTITLLADYYGIGTLIPFSVDVPGPDEAQYIEGDDGPDSLRGYGGDDTLVGGGGDNTILGDDGNDAITAGAGNDFIGGGAGDDVISVTGGANTIYGGLGNDTVHGGAGSDTIQGGGDGRNVLLGNDGDDLVSGGSGGDFIGGGAGNDTVLGNAGADTLYGGAGDDLIGGGSGDDLIFGLQGMNRIYTGLGRDTVQGGTGDDAIYGAGEDAKILWGNDGNDTIYGAEGADLVVGGSGDDQLFGNGGNDLIFLGFGNDFAGGGAGDDQITAGAGGNEIYGGAGDDTIVAGTGRDLMHGGPGADVFIFNSAVQAGIGAGRDVIADFEVGADQIDLRALGLSFADTGTFTGTAGELRYIPGFVLGDLDGDGAQDFAIQVNGAPAMGAESFLL